MTRLRPRPLVARPTVSVVIPCYNYARFLPEAVGSAATQEGVDVEIIVVDDCSTDGSRDVARALASSDPRVRLLLHEKNQGHVATYKDGLRHTTGDHVVLLSADDVLAPGSLARSAAVFEARPDVGLVYGYAEDFADEPPVPRTRPTSWSLWAGRDWIERICVRGTNIIVNPEAVMRRELMDELAGYDPRLPHSGDMELWMRAAARGNVARINGVDQAFYRVHGANMHSTEFAGLLTDMVERKKVFDTFFDESRHLVADPDRLHERSLRALSVEALRAACLAADAGDHHAGPGPAAFAAFALTCSPGIQHSLRWRAYEARTRQPLGVIRRGLAAQAESLRWKVRWRRWRRFGT